MPFNYARSLLIDVAIDKRVHWPCDDHKRTGKFLLLIVKCKIENNVQVVSYSEKQYNSWVEQGMRPKGARFKQNSYQQINIDLHIYVFCLITCQRTMWKWEQRVKTKIQPVYIVPNYHRNEDQRRMRITFNSNELSSRDMSDSILDRW
jgi:hypothetical protein